jgi:hypothetical protein
MIRSLVLLPNTQNHKGPRNVLSIADTMDLKIEQIDVNVSFLHGDPEERYTWID